MPNGEEFSINVPLDGTALPGEAPPAEPIPTRRKRRAPGEAAGTRAEHDAYDTPAELALACVEWVARHVPGPGEESGRAYANVLEPTAGNGSFVTAIEKVLPDSKIVAVDIREECRAACLAAGANHFVGTDALTLPPALIAKADVIVTNPPFKLADALVRHFWAHMKDGAVLAFLLSVTFIGSEDRWAEEGASKPGGLFKIAPLHYMVPIVPRPSFTGDSPKFEAGLFVWVKGSPPPGGASIPDEPIRWVKVRKPRKAKDNA